MFLAYERIFAATRLLVLSAQQRAHGINKKLA